jgi:hypothetical protein
MHEIDIEIGRKAIKFVSTNLVGSNVIVVEVCRTKRSIHQGNFHFWKVVEVSNKCLGILAQPIPGPDDWSWTTIPFTPQEAFEVLQGLHVGDRTLRAHVAAMNKIGK